MITRTAATHALSHRSPPVLLTGNRWIDPVTGLARLVFTNGNFQSNNGLEINVTGGGRAGIYVKNGSFQIKDGASVSNLELYVSNGNIEFGSSTTFSGAMYATGNVEVVSGTVTLGHLIPTAVDVLSAVVFTDGVPGTVASVSTSLTSIGACDAFSLSGVAAGQRYRVTRWREVAPVE